MPVKQKRGFALMSAAKLKEIAAKGGAAHPAHMRSFSVDRELAARAGAKGGKVSKSGGRTAKHET